MVEMAVAEFNLVVDKLNRGLTLNTKHKVSLNHLAPSVILYI